MLQALTKMLSFPCAVAVLLLVLIIVCLCLRRIDGGFKRSIRNLHNKNVEQLVKETACEDNLKGSVDSLTAQVTAFRGRLDGVEKKIQKLLGRLGISHERHDI